MQSYLSYGGTMAYGSDEHIDYSALTIASTVCYTGELQHYQTKFWKSNHTDAFAIDI